jgi:hypothetical protein
LEGEEKKKIVNVVLFILYPNRTPIHITQCLSKA